jgi:hypothetical protein
MKKDKHITLGLTRTNVLLKASAGTRSQNVKGVLARNFDSAVLTSTVYYDDFGGMSLEAAEDPVQYRSLIERGDDNGQLHTYPSVHGFHPREYYCPENHIM